MKTPTNLAELKRYLVPGMRLLRSHSAFPSQGQVPVTVQQVRASAFTVMAPKRDGTLAESWHTYGKASEYTFTNEGFTLAIDESTNVQRPPVHLTYLYVVDHTARVTGPGKYEGEITLTARLDELDNEGMATANIGDVDTFGYYALFSDLTSALVGGYIGSYVGAILHTGSSGFVTATYYDTPEATREAWSEVERSYEATVANDETLDDLTTRGFDKSYVREDGTIRVRCSQCEALVINGLACHETGCPNVSRDTDDDTSED